MQVTSSAISKDGKFADRFGKRGTQFTANGMPSYSIPFEIKNAPENTKSFAVVFEDKDAVEVAGFVWTHWLIADLSRTSVGENESISAKDFVQGANSWASKISNFSIEEASGYGGMAPPNKPHRYELYIYALDTKLNLKPGFRYNDLHFAMQGHILDQAHLVGSYDSQ
ncbi:YbhB/YbcL family Raf kinase inhibitor-like protein [Pasteurella canis]|uniref:YbhB/YbcL family Raf kinase inhibitor-like protein n=1 Tax=Pasteurella canis TaxID=753 RepID=UPI0017476D36|nr:YbhB/YbcL family Raf kinase inhibitor-like protein [Pasteurella canis]UEA17861.1 YbhB/YbcL family Raf kinase inhibitor-like protein [Pasteurella canis]